MAKDAKIQAIENAIAAGTLRSGASTFLNSLTPIKREIIYEPEGYDIPSIVSGAVDGFITMTPKGFIIENNIILLAGGNELFTIEDFITNHKFENEGEPIYFNFEVIPLNQEITLDLHIEVDGEEKIGKVDGIEIKMNDLIIDRTDQYQIPLNKTQIKIKTQDGIDFKGIWVDEYWWESPNNEYEIPLVFPFWTVPYKFIFETVN